MDDRAKRKADQHWEMAGLARKDGDMKDAEKHTHIARMYDQGYSEEDIKAWEKEFNQNIKNNKPNI